MVPGFWGVLLSFSNNFKVHPGLRLISVGPTTRTEVVVKRVTEAAGLRALLDEEHGLVGDSSMGGQWRFAGLIFEADEEGSGKNNVLRTAARRTNDAYLTIRSQDSRGVSPGPQEGVRYQSKQKS